MPVSRRARPRSRRPARRRRGRTLGCGSCVSIGARIGSRSWPTTSSVPPGATASSRLRTPRPSGVRGIDAYCADTRSNAAGSNAPSALASAWWHSTGSPRRSASAAIRSSARRRDVARGHAPALLGQPERVAALAGADVEGAAGGEAADLVDERAVGVAAPDLLAAVAMIPVGLVGRWSGRGSDVVVGEAEADHRRRPGCRWRRPATPAGSDRSRCRRRRAPAPPSRRSRRSRRSRPARSGARPVADRATRTARRAP